MSVEEGLRAKSKELQLVKAAPGPELPDLVAKLQEDTKALDEKLKATASSASTVSQEDLQNLCKRYTKVRRELVEYL